MINPFSKKQLDRAKPFDVEKPTTRKLEVAESQRDAVGEILAFIVVCFFAGGCYWFSYLLFGGR